MTFGAPIALLGLLVVALPIAIHLLTRHRARPQLFPTLRFLPSSPILPRRRLRLTDLALLAIRVAIIALAALALARPRVSGRAPSATGSVSRFIIVDSSASMRRPVSIGGVAFDSASVTARAIAEGSASSLVVRTTTPNDAVSAAGDWLEAQPGLRELVVVSDFQTGTIDSLDLTSLPRDVGIRLVRIPTLARPTMPGGEAKEACAFYLVAADLQQRQAEDDARRAGALSSCDSAGAVRPATIIYIGAGRQPALQATARPLSKPWMARAVQRLHDDPTLQAAAAAAASRGSDALDARFIVLASDSLAKPILLASSSSDQNPRLQLWWLGEPGTIASTALLVALPHALSDAPAPEELDPTFTPSDRLRGWERAPVSHPVAPQDTDDGRWLWGAVLLLLLVEWLVRRRQSVRAASPVESAEMERAA